MERQALVLGASGRFGRAASAALRAAGWDVAAYRRGTDMTAAAMGRALIVNAMNPPAYHDWARLIPAITAQVLAAAKASGATVLIPGNVYVYGTQPGPWGPATPHRPVSRKGTIRAAMEAAYRAAAADGVRTIILRGGDFLDPADPDTIMTRIVLAPLAKGRIDAPGAPDAARAHAWMPDMARAAAMLADRMDGLPAFADLPFPGHTFSITDLADELARQTGRRPRIGRFPWWTLRLAAPFNELARELQEMRYLYSLPHSLDPAPMAALLPGFVPTPFAAIVAAHRQGRVTSTQTSLPRAAAATVSASGSSGAGHSTPDAVTARSAEGRT